jgi:hypothetical protein
MRTLNLYKVYKPYECGWDMYQGFIVATTSEQSARQIHPNLSRWKTDRYSHKIDNFVETRTGEFSSYGTWLNENNDFKNSLVLNKCSALKVELIGTTTVYKKVTVIITDFKSA